MTTGSSQGRSADDARDRLAAARLIVVKVGSAVITHDPPDGHAVNRAWMHDLAAALAGVMRDGRRPRRIVLVSSGAVAAGVEALGLTDRPADLAGLQAAAAVGQPLLMSAWRDAFSIRGVLSAQLLLSRSDFDDRGRFLNVRNCLNRVLASTDPAGDAAAVAARTVPIINENDASATEEISLGDNDILAARVAAALGADALVLLTSVDGVLDARGRVVPCASADDIRALAQPGKTTVGRGGMVSKAHAADIAASAGVTTLIASGLEPRALPRALAGEAIGTVVPARDHTERGRKQWLLTGATPTGEVVIDAGAERALRERHASLLPKGIVRVSGRFDAGDVVAVRSEAGTLVARGLTNFSAEQLQRIVGRELADAAEILGGRTHRAAVHRDNMVVVDR